jgi:hypothetical protein
MSAAFDLTDFEPGCLETSLLPGPKSLAIPIALNPCIDTETIHGFSPPPGE